MVLGGKDLIVDTEVVKAYLTENKSVGPKKGSWEEGVWKGAGLDVLWFPELDHAQVFDTKSAVRAISDARPPPYSLLSTPNTTPQRQLSFCSHLYLNENR
ncbi:hypothetical protein DM02DRAFT_664246 [Periconia macrospinosa]|uniref:Uncharacterized protein n=1 Tax=Periconia macrospinosa TaxID=97972 RepID=A0A2V1CZQ4_9PLEO|nr:hypothetical protein DM02DRAFT_664246 [Periconia macrospinosa]